MPKKNRDIFVGHPVYLEKEAVGSHNFGFNQRHCLFEIMLTDIGMILFMLFCEYFQKTCNNSV